MFTVTGSDPVDCVYITLHIQCSLDLIFVQQYGTELVIKNSWYFFFIRQHAKKTRDLWWQGLPPSVRGTVWKLAIGNDLHITNG